MTAVNAAATAAAAVWHARKASRQPLSCVLLCSRWTARQKRVDAAVLGRVCGRTAHSAVARLSRPLFVALRPACRNSWFGVLHCCCCRLLAAYNARVADEGEYDDQELPPSVVDELEGAAGPARQAFAVSSPPCSHWGAGGGIQGCCTASLHS